MAQYDGPPLRALAQKQGSGCHFEREHGREAREEDIALAVELAAYFSKAREGSSVPVDCVQRRYVKKPSGSKPGFVIFTNQKTYYATPDAQKLEKYLK